MLFFFTGRTNSRRSCSLLLAAVVTLLSLNWCCGQDALLTCDDSAYCDARSHSASCGEEALDDLWHGLHSRLAQSGITLQTDVTQFYMGVVAGGVDREFRYSGHGDYVMNVDSSKLGGPQGLFVKLRAEHRFGEALAGATGGFLPSNVLADLPVADSEDLYLTNVLFTQFLTESFAVFAGKLDTLDGDANDFAHGRGKTQFSNMSLIGNPVALRTVVYSTLGAGLMMLRDGEPIFILTVLNATDTTRTSGFDELFAHGVAIVPELRLPTRFFGLPGHQLFAGTWNSRRYVEIGQDPRVILPNVPVTQQTGSWSLYWNFDQYLFVDPCNEQRGWGIFGRAGIADRDTNPVQTFLSFGVGGRGLFRSREADSFGVGWAYGETSSEVGPLLAAVLGRVGDGHVVEAFYNVEVTRRFHLTFDFQVVDPARATVDTAWVAGLRANLGF